jgi:hypothetical protein
VYLFPDLSVKEDVLGKHEQVACSFKEIELHRLFIFGILRQRGSEFSWHAVFTAD